MVDSLQSAKTDDMMNGDQTGSSTIQTEQSDTAESSMFKAPDGSGEIDIFNRFGSKCFDLVPLHLERVPLTSQAYVAGEVAFEIPPCDSSTLTSLARWDSRASFSAEDQSVLSGFDNSYVQNDSDFSNVVTRDHTSLLCQAVLEPNIQIATHTNLTLVVDEDITGPSFEQLKLMTVA
jgi:hypothetical protein